MGWDFLPNSNVAFYILQDANDDAKLSFACRLIEKAYKERLRIYVHTPTKTIAHQLDELLWTYKDNSFVPHSLIDEKIEPAPPVQIGHGKAPSTNHSLLINLCDDIPVFYNRYRRIAEIVANNENEQALGRERYKLYRQHACELSTHKL